MLRSVRNRRQKRRWFLVVVAPYLTKFPWRQDSCVKWCIEMGVNSTVVDDNEGSTGIFSILKMFDISPGSCSIILSAKRNSVRVKIMLENVVKRVKNVERSYLK